jgi:CSLREA domain-containing protein
MTHSQIYNSLKKEPFIMKSLNRLFRLTLLAALLAVAVLSGKPVPQAHADTVITVGTQDDNAVNGDGLCSLREAITNANNDAVTYNDCAGGTGNDTIDFDDGLGAITITLNANLPTITDPDGLTIDGRNVTIHGNYVHRLFMVTHASLTLNALNLFGGYDGYAGGAITNNFGNLTIIDSTLYFNGALLIGGAIYSIDGDLTVANSRFLENFADGDDREGEAGAVEVNRGTATFINNTFSGNRADVGGDLFLTVGTAATLANNIFANSQGGGHCIRNGGITLSGYHNLFQDAASACVFLSDEDNIGNITGYDPQFVQLPDPANNVSGDYSLRPTSPAIDAGDDAACAQPPVNNTSYNGLPRPQGPHCDIGAYEYPQTKIETYARFISSAAQDGWVLESTETSGVGGTKNNLATTLRIGDDAQRRQYRSLLSFDTGAFPATVTLERAELWLKPAGVVGKSPFLTHGNLLVDIRQGSFANNPALRLDDFKATASKMGVVVPSTLTPEGWYMLSLSAADLQYINRTGLTQFRLRFAKDDNNDTSSADYLKLVSGNGDPYLVPQLLLYYYEYQR